MKFGNRLDRYGPATCPIDGNHIDTVFTHTPDHPMQLVCRNHPGHPLFEARSGEDTIREGGRGLPPSSMFPDRAVRG